MENLIVAAIIAAILGVALWYIRREKRRGVQCVGCPDSAVCSGNCSGCSGNCGGHQAEKNTPTR